MYMTTPMPTPSESPIIAFRQPNGCYASVDLHKPELPWLSHYHQTRAHLLGHLTTELGADLAAEQLDAADHDRLPDGVTLPEGLTPAKGLTRYEAVLNLALSRTRNAVSWDRLLHFPAPHQGEPVRPTLTVTLTLDLQVPGLSARELRRMIGEAGLDAEVSGEETPPPEQDARALGRAAAQALLGTTVPAEEGRTEYGTLFRISQFVDRVGTRARDLFGSYAEAGSALDRTEAAEGWADLDGPYQLGRFKH